MNKKQVLLDFINLTTSIQNIGAELLHTRKYDSVSDLFNDILATLSEENVESTSKSIVTSAIVNKELTMFDIGDNQALMIFGEPKEENDE